MNGPLAKGGIRAKVTVIAVLGSLLAMVVVVLGTAYAMFAILQNAIADDLEDHLDKAQVAVEAGEFERAVRFAGSDIMQVIGADGKVLASSATVQGAATIVDDADLYESGASHLVKERRIESPTGTVTLAAMTSLAPALRTAKTAAWVLAAVMGILLVAVGVFAWRLTGRTLKPVEEMRASVAAMGAADLSARVPVPTGDRDLAPLATTFNELLARIEKSVDEQKRFISDASHELKSPIAATGIMLEAMREYPDAVDFDQLIADLGVENERMARIVGNLLILARHDEGRANPERTPVDLFDVLHEEAALLATRADVAAGDAAGTGIGIDASGVRPVVCPSDRELLSCAVRNLLENAASYAQSRIVLECAEADGVVRIVVSDDGPGIPPVDRERVFGRFVRLEGETDRRAGSTGLGLSVVKSAVEQLGGTVRFAEPELGGATAVVELPVEEPAGAGAGTVMGTASPSHRP